MELNFRWKCNGVGAWGKNQMINADSLAYDSGGTDDSRLSEKKTSMYIEIFETLKNKENV